MRTLKEPNKDLKEILDGTFAAIEQAINNPEAEQDTIKKLILDSMQTTTEIDKSHNIRMTQYYHKIDKIITDYEKKYGVEF